MLKQITLTDFLSYGPGAHTIQLRRFNLLIGPNGSGKSNLVEALAVLRAVPKDLPLPIRQGGGVEEWIWRDERGKENGTHGAQVEVVFQEGLINPTRRDQAVRYLLRFGSERGRFVVLDERVENEHPEAGKTQRFFYFGYSAGHPMINAAGGKKNRRLERADIDPSQSILSQRRDPESYPEVTMVGDVLGKILLYRSWSFGPDAPIRAACRADVRTDRLLEDLSNLPARLATIKGDPTTKRKLLELVKELAPGYSDVEIVPEGGLLQLYLTEGERNVPAHRLSDGTLRFLALLAILLSPGPAQLIVIEEPELGLHPDVLTTLRDLMIEASAHTQLVVTTHSTVLVDAMTDHASDVLVCEKHGSTTSLSRLDQEEIDRWRDRGSLGSLWMSGRLGGTRW